MKNTKAGLLFNISAWLIAVLLTAGLCAACGNMPESTITREGADENAGAEHDAEISTENNGIKRAGAGTENSETEAAGTENGETERAGSGTENSETERAGTSTENGETERAGTGTENGGTETAGADTENSETEIQIFIAASLQNVMRQIAEDYSRLHPEVKIIYHAASSGTLLTQIEEGYECDIFFSAAQKQMDQLEADGLTVEGTRSDVVRNQVVVVAEKDSETKVTGLLSLGKAESIALAGGSVPAGRYTRQALINLGILPGTEDAAAVTSRQVSEALGGVEISEQDNVSKVLLAVLEGSCEAGTVYYTDTYGYEEELKVLETVSEDLTGEVIYPAAQTVNPDADETQKRAAADFLAYMLSDEAAAVFEKFYYESVRK